MDRRVEKEKTGVFTGAYAMNLSMVERFQFGLVITYWVPMEQVLLWRFPHDERDHISYFWTAHYLVIAEGLIFKLLGQKVKGNWVSRDWMYLQICVWIG